LLVIGDGKIFSCAYMPESIDLIEDEISTFECIDSLDFPARACELKPLIVVLDVNSLAIPSLKNLNVFVIDYSWLEWEALIVILAISLLLHR
jgi:hypothetical protein